MYLESSVDPKSLQLGITDTGNITDTAPNIAALLRIDRRGEWTGHVMGEVVKPAKKHET